MDTDVDPPNLSPTLISFAILRRWDLCDFLAGLRLAWEIMNKGTEDDSIRRKPPVSAELYRSELARRRQEIVIDRMRYAITELADLADSAAIGSLAYGSIRSRIEELRAIGRLTAVDIGNEFGPRPPGFDPDREIP